MNRNKKKYRSFRAMVRWVALISLLFFCPALIIACGEEKTPEHTSPQETLKVVATVFPEYDWVRQILGDNPGNVELTLLLDQGVDLHSFQPSAKDVMRIQDADLFLYVGGESDQWIRDALSPEQTAGKSAISLMELLGEEVKEEELVEGMQAEAEEETAENGPEYDEHVWLSLKNACIFCNGISEALIRLDPEHGDTYQANCEAYIKKLEALDAEYAALVAGSATKTLLFADRFPFRYLTDDYGLQYYAAFAGCSAETEASFETITFLAGKTEELGLPAILVIDGSDEGIARTVAENTAGQKPEILRLDSMQSITADRIEAGETYLSVMESNLGVLKKALG